NRKKLNSPTPSKNSERHIRYYFKPSIGCLKSIFPHELRRKRRVAFILMILNVKPSQGQPF
ncbi:MAG: hypothetical protein QXG11_07505, partial [Candidatus Bathyarchaeia archaeon]